MSSGFPTSGIWLAACMFFISLAVLLFTAFAFCCRWRRDRRSSELPGGRCGGDTPIPVETLTPAFCYAPEDIEQGGSSPECAVCLGAVKEGEMVRQLPACKHLYHVVCIDHWLAAHRTCPVCRSQLGSSTGPDDGRSTST